MSRSADVVVLGAGGLLGSHVVRALELAGVDGVCKQQGRRFEGPQQVREYLDGLRPGVVINCIGYLGSEPAEHFRTNGCLPRTVADWCAGRCSCIQVSTNAVFAPGQPREWAPGDPIAPVTPYEQAKAFGEDPRSHVVRVSFVGFNPRRPSLLDRLVAGEPYRDAPYNGVSVWDLAQHLVGLVEKHGASLPSGLEHVHSDAPVRLSELAAVLASRSPCTGEADNYRLLGGGTRLGPLVERVREYQRLRPLGISPGTPQSP